MRRSAKPKPLLPSAARVLKNPRIPELALTNGGNILANADMGARVCWKGDETTSFGNAQLWRNTPLRPCDRPGSAAATIMTDPVRWKPMAMPPAMPTRYYLQWSPGH